MYDTPQEANQKLQTCIVGYDEKPFYITEAGGENNDVLLYGTMCTTGEHVNQEVHKITDPKFEFKSLGSRLGYVNVDIGDYKSACYTRRVPVRAANRTQGLSVQNVRVSRLPSWKARGLSGMGVTWQKLNRQPGFFETWSGKFPDMKSIKTQMKGDVSLRAFGRFLAIWRSNLDLFYLLYKGEPIGHSEDLVTFKVPKHFRYLDELLIEEHGLKVQ